MILEDKLYKSSEVCDILGVSLRTLYRYIEDGKMGSVQLASGRHRFTKDQIEKFLALGVQKDHLISKEEDVFASKPYEPYFSKEQTSPKEEIVSKEEVVKESPIEEKPVVEEKKEEYGGFGIGDEEETSFAIGEEEEETQEEVAEEKEPKFKPLFFKCPFDDLRVIAKLIKRAGENANADYSFTGPAGLSLFYPIKAFQKLHFYVSPDQLEFWKLRLQLEEVPEEEANVVIVKADTVDIFQNSQDRGGLRHVEVTRLKEDLTDLGLIDELREFESKGY